MIGAREARAAEEVFMDSRMDMERFRRILDAYGGEPRRWPQEERSAALELVKSVPEASRLRERALAFDLILDKVPAEEPSPALRAAVLASRARVRPPLWKRSVNFLGEHFAGRIAWRMTAPVLTISLLFGVFLGIFGMTGNTSASLTDSWSGALVRDIYKGY